MPPGILSFSPGDQLSGQQISGLLPQGSSKETASWRAIATPARPIRIHIGGRDLRRTVARLARERPGQADLTTLRPPV